jgi:hypothetical protein
MGRTGPLLLAALIAGAPAALAMNVRTERTPLAHAAGGATLFEVREIGPEGGGSLAYRIEGRAPRDASEFVVSSNFSPGNGTRPQRVSPDMCRERLAALEAELVRRRFAGVSVHPEGCGAKSRSGLVTASP